MRRAEPAVRAVLVLAIGIGETVVPCHPNNALITPSLASLRGLK